jgi:predicted RNase H-like HicB family nuclease
VSQYAIVIEGDGSANYSAYAPDLAGVAATGETLQECEAAMREAIEFHIEGLRLAGETVHEVVNGMIQNGTPIAPDAVLGVVAAGSGCDFVGTTGHSHVVVVAAAA